MAISGHEALGLFSFGVFGVGVFVLSPSWTWVWERAKADDPLLTNWLGLVHLRSLVATDLLNRVLFTTLHDEVDEILARYVRRIRVSALLTAIGTVGIAIHMGIEILS